jgi:hypothetical protein
MLHITAAMQAVQLAKCYIFAVLTVTPVLKYGYKTEYA